MRAKVTIAAFWLSLFVPNAGIAQTTLPREPLRTWEILLTSLQPLDQIRIRDIPRLRRRLAADEWVADRVHILLERVVGACRDLRFNSFAYQEAFGNALRHSYFPGSAIINPTHEQHAQLRAFAMAIEPFIEQAGEPACQWFYARLGPDGTLVQQFRDFTASVEGSYRRQVLWTNADVCRYPRDFWAPMRPHPDDVANACRTADQLARLLKK